MTLSIAFAQCNPTVGDLPGNAALIRRARDNAAALGADLVVFSELVVVGYPPEDLVLRPAVVQAAAAILRELESESANELPGMVVTLPWAMDGRVYNAAALVADGRADLRFKHELPNYGVFDEMRIFTPGPLPEPVRAVLREHLARGDLDALRGELGTLRASQPPAMLDALDAAAAGYDLPRLRALLG